MTEPILSREEVERFADRISLPLQDYEREALVREIESAVLAKACGEPAAWLLRAKNGMIRAAYTTPRTEEDHKIAEIDGDTITALYALNRSKP